MDNQKFFIIVLLVVCAAATLAAAVYYRTRSIRQPAFPQQVEAPRSLSDSLSDGEHRESSGTDMNGQGARQTAAGEESMKHIVRYSESGFLPRTVSVAENDAGDGCLITIINDGNQELTVRLSPPGKDNWGPQYPAIPPRGSIAIDPRFRIEAIAYHNRAQPAQEFGVELGSGCMLE